MEYALAVVAFFFRSESEKECNNLDRADPLPKAKGSSPCELSKQELAF